MTIKYLRLIFSALLLVFCSTPVIADSKITLTPVSIKLHWQHQFQFAGIYAAIEKGFYRQAGLKVTVTTGLIPPYDEVESGKVDFGMSGTGIVVERLRGRPFVALGAIFQSSPYIWLVRADSSIYAPQDFIGKTVTRQSYADDLMAVFYKQHIDTTKIHYVPPSPHDIDNLISGKVDALTAYVSNEPFLMKERGVAYRIIAPKDYGINFYSDILFTSEQYLNAHPQIVSAFRQATFHGWQYAVEHPDEIIDLILKKYNPQHKSRAHLEFEAKKLTELSLYPTVNFGNMTKERWLQIAQVYHQLGMFKSYARMAGFLYQDPSPSPLPILKWLTLVLAAVTTLFVLGYFIKQRHNRLLTEKIQQQTASLQAELNKRKILEDRAHRERQRLQTLLDNTIESVITINQKGIIESYNTAAIKLFGYQPKEIIGQNITQLMPAKYRALHDFGMRRFLATEQSKIIGQSVELLAQHKSGKTIPIEMTLSAFKWEGNYNFTAIARDISIKKAEQQALIVAKEEAEKANQAKSEFMSAMNHELRTPLNAILGFAQLLKLGDANHLNQEQQQNIQYIIDSGEHLLHLINDVLELSKIEAGGIEVSQEHVQISQVINDCLPLLLTQAHQHQIELKQQSTDAIDTVVLADFTRLKQVFINLVTNAIKYNMPGGSVTILPSINDHGRLRLEIIDTGIGIPQHKQHQIFTAFDRLGRENSNIEGTGVGLIVTKRLINAMQGQIGFYSEEDHGSTFWIELPVLDENAPKPRLTDTSIKKTTPTSNSTPETVSGQHNQIIFYIEDNPANIKLMEAFFRRFDNITLRSYQTAESGLAALETTRPSLILMDINLPGISGIEATRHIQQHPDWKDIPVVAVTAAAMKHNIERAEQVFNAYITKPIDFITLSKVLSEQLGASLSD